MLFVVIFPLPARNAFHSFRKRKSAFRGDHIKAFNNMWLTPMLWVFKLKTQTFFLNTLMNRAATACRRLGIVKIERTFLL